MNALGVENKATLSDERSKHHKEKSKTKSTDECSKQEKVKGIRDSERN